MKYYGINCRESSRNIDYTNDKTYRCWKKWMKFGSKTGCHQRADRSFFIKGYQMPVCARCFGVALGYLAAIPGFFLFGLSKLISIAGAGALFTDWFLQAAGFKESTNRRRLITGILGGYGIMSFQLLISRKVKKFLFRTHK